GLIKKLTWLEGFNRELFSPWIESTTDNVINSRAALKQLIDAQGAVGVLPRQGEDRLAQTSGQFQKIFYLLKSNTGFYLDQSRNLIRRFDTNPDADFQLSSLDEVREQLALLQATINALSRDYDAFFWSEQHFQDSQYYEYRQFVFVGLIIASVLVLLVFVVVSWQVRRFVYAYHEIDAQNILLNTRDLETGLFNKQSFQVFGAQELARAKRQNAPLTLLYVRIESYAQIRDKKGEKDAEHFVYQIACQLRKTCRLYDGIYRYSENAFTILMSDSSREDLYQIMTRIKQTVFNQDLFVHDDKLKLKPRVHVGFAFYPNDAQTVEGLVGQAILHLTDQDGKVVGVSGAEGVVTQTEATTGQGDEQPIVAEPHVAVARDEPTPAVEQENKSAEVVVSPPEEAEGYEVLVSREDSHEEDVPAPKEEQWQDGEGLYEPKAEVVEAAQISTEPEVVVAEPVAKKYVSGPIDDEKLRLTWESLVSREVPANINRTQTVFKESFVPPEKDVITQLLESVVQNAHSNPDAEKSVADVVADAVPDVVAALNQEESIVKDLPTVPRTTIKVSEPVTAPVTQEVAQEDTPPIPPARRTVQFETFNDGDDDFDDITNISDIQIVNSENEGDVILVDFDEEKPDLASKFRRKLRDKRRKIKIGF
ncbi:MAG: GGDEF protein, partial [uncultured bacterium]